MPRLRGSLTVATSTSSLTSSKPKMGRRAQRQSPRGTSSSSSTSPRTMCRGSRRERTARERTDDRRMRKPFIVISGLPGAAEDDPARRLAPALNLPLIDKDDILDRLFESKGSGDAATSEPLVPHRGNTLILNALRASFSDMRRFSFFKAPRNVIPLTGRSRMMRVSYTPPDVGILLQLLVRLMTMWSLPAFSPRRIMMNGRRPSRQKSTTLALAPKPNLFLTRGTGNICQIPSRHLGVEAHPHGNFGRSECETVNCGRRWCVTLLIPAMDIAHHLWVWVRRLRVELALSIIGFPGPGIASQARLTDCSSLNGDGSPRNKSDFFNNHRSLTY